MNGDYYLSTQKAMLLRGGDTDTNAAIVGGLIGALVGFERLPAYMVQSVMDFDNEN